MATGLGTKVEWEMMPPWKKMRYEPVERLSAVSPQEESLKATRRGLIWLSPAD
jgi:hypothetical protein